MDILPGARLCQPDKYVRLTIDPPLGTPIFRFVAGSMQLMEGAFRKDVGRAVRIAGEGGAD